jgi:hypothetical protein
MQTLPSMIEMSSRLLGEHSSQTRLQQPDRIVDR